MLNLQENIKLLNQLIKDGKTLEAIMRFYANNVSVQENEDEPTIGKQAYLDLERKNLEKVATIKCELLNQAISPDNNVVFSEWCFEIEYKDKQKYKLTEVSVQNWSQGQIIAEKFYYKQISKIED
jgi:hypothetical protein